MDESKVTQKGNKVDGDQAGHDINKQVTNLNFDSSQRSISAMQTLLKKFKDEREKNPQLTEFIEELDYYNKPLDGDVIGLEQKLINGKQEDFIDYALRMKERYHKKLMKYQFSEAAQLINLHLLALVESYFMHHIYPQICNGQTSENVNSLIQELLINPMLGQLDDNPLGFNAQEVNGMIYFLTGNCHIKWNN
jgi:hypothetical protein